MDERPYYYRLRGKTLGPFDLRQMRQRAAAGQVGKRSAVSRDSTDWATGESYPELFEGERSGPPPSQPDTILAPPQSGGWYCQINGSRQGPHDVAVIQHLVQTGKLSSEDYVFKTGQTEWTRVRDTVELLQVVSGPPTTRVVTGGGGVTSGEVFCRECGTSLKRAAVICPTCGVPTGAGALGNLAARENKSKYVAAMLAFFLGGFGAHHFYLGNVGLGIVYLLLCWTLVPALIAFIEFIVFLVMPTESFDAKYNRHPA